MTNNLKLAFFGSLYLISQTVNAFDVKKPDSVWQTHCTTLAGYSYFTTLSYAGENVIESTEYFFEKDCPKNAVQVRVNKYGKNTYELRTIGTDSVVEVQSNYRKLNLAAITEEGANMMNDYNICAKKDWAQGKSTDVVDKTTANECVNSITLPWFMVPFSAFIKPKIKAGFYLGKTSYQFITSGNFSNAKGEKVYISEPGEVLKDPLTDNLSATRVR